jgi:repressor LexA
MATLSERQQRILDFIRQYLEEHNYPPTIREIGKAAGISSTSVVKYNLERLQEKKLIERSDEVSRGLRLTDGRRGPAPTRRASGSSAAQARRSAGTPSLRAEPFSARPGMTKTSSGAGSSTRR